GAERPRGTVFTDRGGASRRRLGLDRSRRAGTGLNTRPSVDRITKLSVRAGVTAAIFCRGPVRRDKLARLAVGPRSAHRAVAHARIRPRGAALARRIGGWRALRHPKGTGRATG